MRSIGRLLTDFWPLLAAVSLGVVSLRLAGRPLGAALLSGAARPAGFVGMRLLLR